MLGRSLACESSSAESVGRLRRFGSCAVLCFHVDLDRPTLPRVMYDLSREDEAI